MTKQTDLTQYTPAPVVVDAPKATVYTDPVALHRERVMLMRRLMASGVMQKGVHYDKIPGTPKNTLLKPGAEVALVACGYRQDLSVEDLSTEDAVKYRVTAHAMDSSGMQVADGVGEASSDEEKYRWRKAVCQAEYDDMPETRRRMKYYKNGGSVPQVRTEPADSANTILKMAAKRARVDLALTACCLSELFTQDMDDRIARDREAAEQVTPKRMVFQAMTEASATGATVKALAEALGISSESTKWSLNDAERLCAALRDMDGDVDPETGEVG